MSVRKSIIMMTNTGDTLETFNVTGDKIRTGSYWGYTDGLTTVQVVYQNLTGGFGIQGTLALDPKEEDWFWIHLNDLQGNYSDKPYITYPKDPLNPTGGNGSLPLISSSGDTGSEAFTFIGNFTYLRAMLVRDYIAPVPTQINGRWYLGQIDKVLVTL